MRDVPTIQTQRLRLRLLTMQDAPAIARYAGDADVARMVSRLPVPYFVCAAEGWIMTLNARAPLGEDHVRAIEADGAFVGVIGAHQQRAGLFEIGYWLGKPFWGRGYASEALGGFVDAARALGALEAGHFIDNPASGRVLAKNGFEYTGEVEQLFSLGRGARAACRRMAYARANPRARPAREAAVA